MFSKYNKLLFTPDDTNQSLIKYYMPNDNNAHSFIKYLSGNEISHDIINSTINQEMYTCYNPFSISLNTSNAANNKFTCNYNQAKSENFYFDSPKIIDCEITMEEDLYPDGKENDKFHQQNTNPINVTYRPLTIVNKNLNQNRARSPFNLRRINYI